MQVSQLTRDGLDWKILAAQHSPTFKKHKGKFQDRDGEQFDPIPYPKILEEVTLAVGEKENEWIGVLEKLDEQEQEYLVEVEELKQNLSRLENEQVQLYESIRNLETQKKTIEETLEVYQGIDEKHDQLKLQHQLLNETCEGLQNRLTQIETKKTKIKNELAASKARVDNLENHVQNVQQEVVIEKAKVEDLEEKLVEMQAQQDEAQANLKELKKDVEDLQNTLDEEVEKVKQLELDKDALELRADGLESKVDLLEVKLEAKKLSLQQAKDAVGTKDAEISQISSALEIKKIEVANSSFLSDLDGKVWKHLVSNHSNQFFSSPLRKTVSLITGLFQYILFKFYSRPSIQNELKEATRNSTTFANFEIKMNQMEKLAFSKFY